MQRNHFPFARTQRGATTKQKIEHWLERYEEAVAKHLINLDVAADNDLEDGWHDRCSWVSEKQQISRLGRHTIREFEGGDAVQQEVLVEYV